MKFLCTFNADQHNSAHYLLFLGVSFNDDQNIEVSISIDRSIFVFSKENHSFKLCVAHESAKKMLQKLKDRKVLDKNLSALLENERLLKDLLKTKSLTQQDLKYLMNKIDFSDFNQLLSLGQNTSLIKHILNEFLLNKEIVDKFNRMTTTLNELTPWYDKYSIYTIFDLIEYYNKNNEEILELIDLNKYIYSFDLNEDQKLEVAVLIVDNEIAKNRLSQIIDNHVESNFDFESLMNYLKKKEKKNILNI